jgi:tRNA G10  N-methylase Trm11
LPEEDRLYAGFLREAMRVLAPEGRLVMLTDRVNAVQAACQSLDISMQPSLTVSLHGMLCGVFTFRF